MKNVGVSHPNSPPKVASGIERAIFAPPGAPPKAPTLEHRGLISLPHGSFDGLLYFSLGADRTVAEVRLGTGIWTYIEPSRGLDITVAVEDGRVNELQVIVGLAVWLLDFKTKRFDADGSLCATVTFADEKGRRQVAPVKGFKPDPTSRDSIYTDNDVFKPVDLALEFIAIMECLSLATNIAGSATHHPSLSLRTLELHLYELHLRFAE